MTKEEFINATEQFNYGCDAGSLGIVVNGKNFMVSNCAGDGEGTVYITDKSHLEITPPFDDESVLTFGSYDKEAERITVGLRRFDICEYIEPVMIMKGRHFSISRIRNSHDFIIRVTDLKFTRKPKSNRVGTILDADEYIDIYDDVEKSQVESKLESFLLESANLKEWPTRGTPIHWHIVVKDEDYWFNEWAHLHQNEDPNKGDFTEIHYVPGFLIKIAGWRGDVMFSVPLYPKEEKPVYTLKEGIEKISEFIIAGKIEIPGFEYN
jgi:hypothetical protein